MEHRAVLKCLANDLLLVRVVFNDCVLTADISNNIVKTEFSLAFSILSPAPPCNLIMNKFPVDIIAHWTYISQCKLRKLHKCNNKVVLLFAFSLT